MTGIRLPWLVTRQQDCGTRPSTSFIRTRREVNTMFGSFPVKADNRRLRIVLATLAVLLVLAAAGITIALTADTHLATHLGMGVAWGNPRNS